MFSQRVVNTDHIDTVEVKVTPFYKDVRTFINTAAGVTATVTTVALALEHSLNGYAWFAPALASVNALNLILGYFSKRGVESKNVRTEKVILKET